MLLSLNTISIQQCFHFLCLNPCTAPNFPQSCREAVYKDVELFGDIDEPCIKPRPTCVPFDSLVFTLNWLPVIEEPFE